MASKPAIEKITIPALENITVPGTVGHHILQRMLELTIQADDEAERTAMPDVKTLWRIITGERGIGSLELALIARNLHTDPLVLLGQPDPRPQIIGPCTMPDWAGDAEESEYQI